jgi:Neutral/alkaline non-lysosomal ceramidase, N-terminal
MKSFILILPLLTLSCTAFGQNALRVGAARADITPAQAGGLKNVWGNEFNGVHDHIYVRAVVLDNGSTSAALIAVDTSSTADTLPLRQRMQQEFDIPAQNIMITATHGHNAPVFAIGPAAQSRQLGTQSAAFYAKAEQAMFEAVRKSKASLQPARMGLAAGHADININRDEFVGDRWKTGRNPARPSDKTVWVLRFDTLAGEPLAFFVNYGVHGLMLGPDNDQITGDLPGSTSRFIESYYHDKAVALWTSGPAGDQNPISSSWDLDDVLTHKIREPGEQGFQLSDTLGRVLGEEAIRASDSANFVTTARIWSDEKLSYCPGRQRDPQAPAGVTRFIDGEPQPMRLGLLMINNIALAGFAGEVVTNIYYHLEQQSPLVNTVLVSLSNGRVSYIIDDAAYDALIFENRASSLKRGCGESTIVNGFTEMIEQGLKSAH